MSLQSNERLPNFVGLYRRRDNDLIPKIVRFNQKLYSIEEKKLRRFFKCSKIDLFRKSCFATKNFKIAFLSHLYKTHPKDKFYCIYCFPTINRDVGERTEKTMYSPEALVIHMLETHKYRRFQCNLCLYRAISADHINIHQSLIHIGLHEASLNHKQIGGQICKIIECPPIDGVNESQALPKLSHYYNRYHKKRNNNDANHDKFYQCLYCDFMNQLKHEVIDHCVERHADYPIMFYNREPEITSTQPSNANNNSNSNSNSPKYLTQMDLFSGKQLETQENSVTSTGLHEAIDLDSDDSDNGCVDKNHENRGNKRQRISKIPKGSIANNSPFSQRLANGSSFKSRSSAQSVALLKLKKAAFNSADKLSLIRIPQRDGKLHPNVTAKKSVTPRSRPSLSVSPPSMDFMGNMASNSSNAELEKKFICLLCNGNHSEMKESSITSHLHMYHNSCKVKAPNLPFCCSHCMKFCGTEAEVNCHSKCCPKKTSHKTHKVFVFIVPKDEHKTGKEERVLTCDSSDDENTITFNKRDTNLNIDKQSDHQLREENSHSITHKRNEVNQSKSNETTKRLKTTIEVALPETDEDIQMLAQPEYVCLFCEVTSADRESAKAHLETHFPDINTAIDDYEVTKPIHKWFKIFIDKQYSLFEKMSDSFDLNDLSDEFPYSCPICLKLAKLKNVRAKRFKTFWELKTHYWEHSCWQPITCKICKPDHYLPNCDFSIVRHLNTKHNDKLVQNDNPFIKQIIGNKMRSGCTAQQRSALNQTFINSFRYEVLDSHIENTLKMVSEEQEHNLRQIHNCPDVLPKVKLFRLPKINFDDQSMVTKYLKRLNQKQNSLTISKASNSNKVLEEIELGSSSDGNEDSIPVITGRKKPKATYNRLFNCESSHVLNSNRNNRGKNASNQHQLNHSHVFNHNLNNDCVSDVGKDRNTSNDVSKGISENISASKQMNASNKLIETSNVLLKEIGSHDNNQTKGTINYNQNDSIVSQESEPGRPSTSVTPIHINEATDSTKKFVCCECNKLFESKQQIREHYTQQHTGLSVRFTRTIL